MSQTLGITYVYVSFTHFTIVRVKCLPLVPLNVGEYGTEVGGLETDFDSRVGGRGSRLTGSSKVS